MADLSLDIIVIPTYSSKTLGIMDISVYPDSPPTTSPTLEVTVPGFGLVSLPFTQSDFNILNSYKLELTEAGEDLIPIPDGLYTLTYSVTPSYENYVTKTIMRTEQLQQQFDNAFMQLDMTECDRAIKKQQKEELYSIEFLIQGAISAANNCATDLANTLYLQAAKQLSYFLNNQCGCSGTNYVTNFA